MRLTDEQERWLTALESGKFRQGKHVMRNGDRYCCFGVAADVLAPGRWVAVEGAYDDEDWRWEHEGETARDVLPESVRDRLQLHTTSGLALDVGLDEVLQACDAVGVPEEIIGALRLVGATSDETAPPEAESKTLCLATLNDYGVGHAEIAALVRRQPEWFFRDRDKGA